MGFALESEREVKDGKIQPKKGECHEKIIAAAVISLGLGVVPLLAQDKKQMPMKEGMPMKGEGMQGGGMMGTMKDMQGRMGEMKKDIGGMMKGQGMMRSEDMKGMGKGMGDMSGMMGEMGCRVPADSEHGISESKMAIDRRRAAGRKRWPNRVDGTPRSATR